MSEFEYSLDALNAKSAFYRAQTIIYVEGDDDVMFWEEVFSHIADFKFEIEPAGGSGEIDKHIANIEAGTLDAIATRDADFLRFTQAPPKSIRVVYSHGYSMENSLYTAETIYQIARSWCKSLAITYADCDAWLNDLAKSFEPLVALDIANAISNTGVTVLGENCTRFMTGQTSATPCQNKVATHVSKLSAHLPKKTVASSKAVIGADPTAPLNNLRGHFLASAVAKFLLQKAKCLGKKINVSADALYAAAIAHFGRAFKPAHPHFNYYRTLTTAAAASF